MITQAGKVALVLDGQCFDLPPDAAHALGETLREHARQVLRSQGEAALDPATPVASAARLVRAPDVDRSGRTARASNEALPSALRPVTAAARRPRPARSPSRSRG